MQLVTNNPEIHKMVGKIKANGRVCDCFRCTRNEGTCPKVFVDSEDKNPRFTHDVISYNFKTMEFQAALANEQLKKADWITKTRNENVKKLNDLLEKYSDKLKPPKHEKNISYLAYPIIIKNNKIISRRKIREELEKKALKRAPFSDAFQHNNRHLIILKKHTKTPKCKIFRH